MIIERQFILKSLGNSVFSYLLKPEECGDMQGGKERGGEKRGEGRGG